MAIFVERLMYSAECEVCCEAVGSTVGYPSDTATAWLLVLYVK